MINKVKRKAIKSGLDPLIAEKIYRNIINCFIRKEMREFREEKSYFQDIYSEDKMKKQLGPSDAIFPVPAALVVSGNGDKANIITVAWIGIVSSSPPTIGISLKNTRYSLEVIRKSKEFTINIPSSNYFKETDYCGLVSGRERNKFKDTYFTPVKGLKVNTPIIKECPYNMECRVTQEIVLGDWVLILGEIVETHIDNDKVDMSNKANIDISKVNPLVYCARVREYWSLGKKLGKGFQSGKEIRRSVL